MLLRAARVLFISFLRRANQRVAGILFLGLLIGSVAVPLNAAKPVFDGSSLILPQVQVGEDILSITLDLINPADLTFQLDFQSLGLVAPQAQAACLDPYFSFAQAQLVIPVLEVGDARFQVYLDLVDVDQGLFAVSPISPLLIGAASADAPAFSVWQTGDSIAMEWGSPSDNVDGYRVWYTLYQGGAPMAVEDVGALTELSVELPLGSDFCLAVSSYGPDGDSDLSEIERFVNAEVPYFSFETDDPSLPSIFLPTSEVGVGMALMYDAAEDDKPYGAVFDSSADDENLVLAFNPDTGLLSRLTHGDVIFHFMNYSATTVDVVETPLAGDSTVHPNLPLSNHAISIIENLIEAFESPEPNPLVSPGEPDPGHLQSADWAKKGLELGLDVLQSAGFESETDGDDLLAELRVYVDGFRGDIFKSQAGDDSELALEGAQQLLDTLIDQFDCAGEAGFSCAAYALNQADFDVFRVDLPDIADQIQNLLDAMADAAEKQQLLNQDCLAIVDEEERLACLEIQGNPEPGEQEDPLPINESQNDAIAQEIENLENIYAQATQSLNAAELQTMMLLNELSFDYQQYIGQRIWVTGYYGDESNNEYGYAYLLNDPTLLDTDEQLPQHSHAMLDGDLPPQDWNRSEVLIYGEIKDFATASGLSSTEPTPLITVIDAVQLSLPLPVGQPGNPLLIDGPQFMVTPGTQASACDRVVIIAGGIDARGNYPRYRQAVTAIHTKAKNLGFSDAQIEVFYFDGSEIDVGGNNIVDEAATKQKILDHLAALKAEMEPSCTLSLFVSDHGTGYNEAKAVYRGERPVFSGTEFSGGTTYPENTFMFNAKAKTYQRTAWILYRGTRYRLYKNDEGKIEFYSLVGETFTFLGTDNNNDGLISEAETDTDFDGDGEKKADFGWNVADLETRLASRVYFDNIWDTDRDGVDDVRLRWDGMRYVAERKVGEDWQEMGRDTNGDYMIDAADGGVDWNLDGDKNDHVGFHEGINLLGTEVLWDDEFADALKMLHDSGIHNNVFMVSCYSGGFVLNVQDYVENIFAGSKEDDTHRSFDGGSGEAIHDTKGFLDNWHGIDTPSWKNAEMKAEEADTPVGDTNNYLKGGVEKFETNSLIQEVGEGEYLVKLDLPFEVLDDVYDFEFIYGLQVPRWDAADFEILSGLDSLDVEPVPGGIRAFDITGILDGLKFRVRAPEGLEMMRIELTDFNHNRHGYIMAMPGIIEVPTPKLESNSVFQETASGYRIDLDIPDDKLGEIHDFEFIYDNQDPPWPGPVFPLPGELPEGLEFEVISGGVRFFSDEPLEDHLKLEIITPSALSEEMLRIELTDAAHETVGWVMAMPGTVLVPTPLIDPCVTGNFVVNYNNGTFPPDNLFFGCNGQALLANSFPGPWTQGPDLLTATFGGGLSFFHGWPSFFPTLPPGAPTLIAPPDLCYTGVEWQHFGESGSNATICPANPATTLNLLGDRFQVQATWNDPPNGGPAQGFPLTDNSGGFFFFDPQNAELVVKVLDGCGFNDRFWVFASANTNVEFTLTVTDTQTAEVMNFLNPLGTPAPAITDTEAFATCP